MKKILVLTGLVFWAVLGMSCGNNAEDHSAKTSFFNRESAQQDQAPAEDASVKDADGNSYRVVTIGNQTWMAENLKLRTSDSWCYDDNELMCEKYGRLYTWAAAMGYPSRYNHEQPDEQYPHKNVCPAGFRIPTESDFETLFAHVKDAGELISTTLWGDYNGTDKYGFNALPAGFRMDQLYPDCDGEYSDCITEYYQSLGERAEFWTSTKVSNSSVKSVQLYMKHHNILNDDKSYGYSVRCIKDE